MIEFRCGNCNYVFKKEARPRACPYCDRPGNLMESGKVLSSLDKIKDV